MHLLALFLFLLTPSTLPLRTEILFTANPSTDIFSILSIDTSYETTVNYSNTISKDRTHNIYRTIQARDLPPGPGGFAQIFVSPSYNIKDPRSGSPLYFIVPPEKKLVQEFEVSYDAEISPRELAYYGVEESDFRMGFGFLQAFNYETGASIDFGISKNYIMAFQGSDGGNQYSPSHQPVYTRVYSSAVVVANYTAGERVRLKTVVNRPDGRLEWYVDGRLKVTQEFRDIPAFPVYADYDFGLGAPVASRPEKFRNWQLGIQPKIEAVHMGPYGDPQGQVLLNTTWPGHFDVKNHNFLHASWEKGELTFGSTSTLNVYLWQVRLEC